MKKAVIIGTMESYYAEGTVLNEVHNLFGPPLAPLAVASYLKANGIPVEMIDIEMDFGATMTTKDSRIVYKRLCDYLRAHADEYAWVGLSIHANLSYGMTDGFSLIDDIHAALPNTPLVLGGYFPTFSHEELFKKYPFVSAIVRGSGEIAALKIAQRVARGEPLVFADIPNLAWVEDGKVRATPITTPPLADLPVVDFGLLRNVHAYEKFDVQSARGCLFKCDFCPESKMREFDSFPLECFNQQLENLEANSSTNLFHMWDPMFGTGLQRTLDVAKVIAARPRKYHWACLGRADTLPLDALPALRASGLESIFFGVESANPNTLLKMGKLNNPNMIDKFIKQQYDAITACFQNDITPCISLMTGYPGDVKEDYHNTLAFLDELQQAHDRAPTEPGFLVTAQVTRIYSSTPLKEKIDEHTLGDSEITSRWQDGGQFETYATSSELSREQIEDYGRQMIQKAVFTDPCFERMKRFWGRPAPILHAFIAAHPEVIDEDGVFQPARAYGKGLNS